MLVIGTIHNGALRIKNGKSEFIHNCLTKTKILNPKQHK